VLSPPARIPKLKYRNPLPAGETVPSLDERRCPLTQPCDADEPPTPTSHCWPSFDTASLTSASVASTASSAASDDSRSSKKKKKASVFGFLSLKEPSQLAFEQYAEAQRKQALEKGSPSPTGRPASTYAAKKLPGNVPKVNSKWDGVPEALKNRNSKSSPASTKNRHSVISQDSQKSHLTALPRNASRASVMTDGTRNPPNSVATPAASVSSRSTSPSPSMETLPEISYYFPEPIDHSALATQPSQPLTYRPASIDSSAASFDSFDSFDSSPPSLEPAFDLSAMDQVPGLLPGSEPAPPLRYQVADVDSSPQSPQPGFSFSSPDQVPGLRSASPASSTSSSDTIVRDTADVIFKKLNDQPQQRLWGDAPAVQPHDAASAAAVPESHDFLFDDLLPADTPKAGPPMTTPHVAHYAPTRPVQNFSRPTRPIQLGDLTSITPSRPARTTAYRSTPISSGLPTLYEASVNSTESDDSDETVQDHANDDAQSIAPSTVAPSIMSARWHDSPRERLGLGGRLRMDAALPWGEGSGDPPGKQKKSFRLSVFGKVTPRA
jgi:hypothetical protein